MALLLTQFLFRAFYNQEELNNYIQSHYRMNVSHEAINQARLKKKQKKKLQNVCRIFLKDKDENDQADDKFFKNPERQGIHD